MGKSKQSNKQDDDMLPEYDFSKGVRGKHHRAILQGYTVTIHHADGTTSTQNIPPESGVILLDPDVQKYFPDSESVNKILRSLIALIPETPT